MQYMLPCMQLPGRRPGYAESDKSDDEGRHSRSTRPTIEARFIPVQSSNNAPLQPMQPPTGGFPPPPQPILPPGTIPSYYPPQQTQIIPLRSRQQALQRLPPELAHLANAPPGTTMVIAQAPPETGLPTLVAQQFPDGTVVVQVRNRQA